MYFMSLPLTASPENSVTKISCYAVKGSTVNRKDSFHWKRLHSVCLGDHLSKHWRKKYSYSGYSVPLTTTHEQFHGSVYAQLHFPDLTQGKTINTLTTFGEVNKGNACIFSLRDCKSTTETKARTLKCIYGTEKHHHHNPHYFCICQQILHTDCPPTAHMHEQFLLAPSYFFLPKSVTILKTSLQAFLK